MPAAHPLARAALAAVGALAFPTLCLGCDRRVADGAARPGGALPLCDACLRHLPRAGDDTAGARLARLPPGAARPGRTLALWAFDAGGTIRRLQHALKYGGRPDLGLALGALMGRAVARAWGAPAYDAVVAVPLARGRLLARGYNQAERLAQGVARSLGGLRATDTLLVRARTTETQTHLSRAERALNVGTAFALGTGVATEGLVGQRLLLVDDVLTTGATLAAAAAPLLAAGAAVDGAVLACVAD